MSQDDYAPLLERALRRIRAAKAEVAESRRPPSARCPVAIVGHACRLPGADDPEAFWALLRDGVDAVGPAPADRWPGVDWYDPSGADPEKAYVDAAGYLRDLAGFDPEHFGISPREAATMDPQQRLLLEVAWEALERAGLAPGGLRGSRTGVYVGASNHEYGKLYTDATGRLHPFVGTSSILSVMAGRIAYALGLEGPALTVDTACSSALVAVALGVRALQAGDCARAICGGVNAIVDPQTLIAMCSVGMLSRGGRCRSFDAGADGFARGEGCGLVVLERLDDARRAGRPILAVIRGVAVNQDGRSAGLTAPNRHAQVAVIRAALADGALDARAVVYVESHGTGTALGDPIEMSALGEALCAGRPADAPLVVGAAKSNIGHLEPAAGVAGLIKATLAIGHGVVPPNLHFATPNPHIAWEGLPVHLPTAPTPLRPGLVGVSAFGLSGTNAHVVIGPPPEAPPAPPLRARARWIVPLSARTPAALAQLAARYAEHLDADRTAGRASRRRRAHPRVDGRARDGGRRRRRRRGRRAAGDRRRRGRAGHRLRLGAGRARRRSASSSPARARSTPAWGATSTPRSRSSPPRSTAAPRCSRRCARSR
ncbi:MAG: hypothetical protein H6701_04280 [Myxococcales bacterium]|nr:hypothetical protein [Myxococcales bacterium]